MSRKPLVPVVVFIVVLLSISAALYYFIERTKENSLAFGQEPDHLIEASQWASCAPWMLVLDRDIENASAPSTEAEHRERTEPSETTATLHFDDFENDGINQWRVVSQEDLSPVARTGYGGSAGLAVSISNRSSFLYRNDLTRAQEAYLTFWFNPNDMNLPLDGTLWSKTLRIASVIGPEGVLVALRIYKITDHNYRAYLEWSDENDGLQFDHVLGHFDLVNNWQKIMIGYQADNWIAVWIDDELKQQIEVTHIDPFGTGIRVGKLNLTDDVLLDGTILYDEVAFQILHGADLWVDGEKGDDNNDGRNPEQALRTIQKAAGLAGPGTTVHILSGVYRETIKPATSGNEIEPVLYVAEDGPGTVVVRGSKPSSTLTWTRLNQNGIGLPPGVNPTDIYYTDLSSWGLDGPPHFVVELDHAGDIRSRLFPAREPDWQAENDWRVHEFWWSADGGAVKADCDPTTDSDPHCDAPWRSFTQLTDTTNDVNPTGIEPGNLTTLDNLTGATLVAMDAQHAHYVYRSTILSHDSTAGSVTVDEDSENDGKPGLGWGSKYYVENHPTLLDHPGEWWFDKTTGYFYLWSPNGENPETMNLEISQLDTGIDLGNRSYIALDGLRIELFNGDAYRIYNENPWHKAHGNTLSNTTLQYANRGVFLYQYVSGDTPPLYAIDTFLIEHSEIAYMDTVGIDTGFWWPGAPAPDQFSHSGIRNLFLLNNELHHLGFNSEHRSAVGVRIFFPDKLRLEGNHVHHVGQNGVHIHLSLIDSSKVFDFSPEEIKLGEILIRNNIFEKACQLASDCGALKIGGSKRPYTHVFRDVLVTGNVFRDTFGWSDVSIKRGINTIGDGNGFYVDMASGIHAYRNIAYNNTGAGFKLTCLWRDGVMIYYNNIAANNHSKGFKFSGNTRTCDDHNGSVNTQLVNNILINNESHGIQFTSSYEDNTFGHLIVDHNLYHSNGWKESADWEPADIQLYQGSRSAQYFHGIAEIRDKTPWEDHGVEDNPILIKYDVSDHNRYDASWPDFHITDASTNALDRGTASLPASLTRLLTHFGVDDVCMGNAFDIGRFEAVGMKVTPMTQTIRPGSTTLFILSVYPLSFPDPLTLKVDSPSSLLTLELSSTNLIPGETVLLVVKDNHNPSITLMPGARYAISITASHGKYTKDTFIHLRVCGGRFYCNSRSRVK
jgi:hypothetical protein